jgi:hypothetical protein
MKLRELAMVVFVALAVGQIGCAEQKGRKKETPKSKKQKAKDEAKKDKGKSKD